jgi:hypothetical protein
MWFQQAKKILHREVNNKHSKGKKISKSTKIFVNYLSEKELIIRICQCLECKQLMEKSNTNKYQEVVWIYIS